MKMQVSLRRVLAFENDIVFSPIIPRIALFVRKRKMRRARWVTGSSCKVTPA
jgi:hypothetical protein